MRIYFKIVIQYSTCCAILIVLFNFLFNYIPIIRPEHVHVQYFRFYLTAFGFYLSKLLYILIELKRFREQNILECYKIFLIKHYLDKICMQFFSEIVFDCFLCFLFHALLFYMPILQRKCGHFA